MTSPKTIAGSAPTFPLLPSTKSRDITEYAQNDDPERCRAAHKLLSAARPPRSSGSGAW